MRGGATANPFVVHNPVAGVSANSTTAQQVGGYYTGLRGSAMSSTSAMSSDHDDAVGRAGGSYGTYARPHSDEEAASLAYGGFGANGAPVGSGGSAGSSAGMVDGGFGPGATGFVTPSPPIYPLGEGRRVAASVSVCPCGRRMGNTLTLYAAGPRATRFPYLFMIGPDWPCMTSTYALITVPSTIFLIFVAPRLHPAVVAIGALLAANALFWFSLTACSDPGYVHAQSPDELFAARRSAEAAGTLESLSSCAYCNVLRAEGTAHCFEVRRVGVRRLAGERWRAAGGPRLRGVRCLRSASGRRALDHALPCHAPTVAVQRVRRRSGPPLVSSSGDLRRRYALRLVDGRHRRRASTVLSPATQPLSTPQPVDGKVHRRKQPAAVLRIPSVYLNPYHLRRCMRHRLGAPPYYTVGRRLVLRLQRRDRGMRVNFWSTATRESRRNLADATLIGTSSLTP